MIQFIDKYGSVVDEEDNQHFQRLIEEFNEISGQRDGQKCLDKRLDIKCEESLEVWTQPSSDLSDKRHDKKSLKRKKCLNQRKCLIN